MHCSSDTGESPAPPLNSSFIVGPSDLLSIPKVVATLPLGSRSTSRTLRDLIPNSGDPLASAAARLTAVVVLAVPPLWLTTAMTTGPPSTCITPPDSGGASTVNVTNHCITGTGTSDSIFLMMWWPVTPLIFDSGLRTILWLTT